MFFYDDNEYDNKKTLFDNKYGKLTSTLDIVDDIKKKENKKDEQNDKNKNILQKKKRKRHDSSDEDEKKLEAEKKKEKEKEKEKNKNDNKEAFIEQINNVENLNLEKDNTTIKGENKDNDNKDSWKRGFVDIEELNKRKIEVKEMSKILDDPMKNLLSKNKVIEETDELIKRRGFYLPKCKFAPLNNRFDIKPGYRWDGVNRSNGFENKIMNLNFNINK